MTSGFKIKIEMSRLPPPDKNIVDSGFCYFDFIHLQDRQLLILEVEQLLKDTTANLEVTSNLHLILGYNLYEQATSIEKGEDQYLKIYLDALDHLTLSAEMKNRWAIEFLGNLYSQDEIADIFDSEIYYLERAGRAGVFEAYNKLGEIYFHGKEKNIPKAMKYYLESYKINKNSEAKCRIFTFGNLISIVDTLIEEIKSLEL